MDLTISQLFARKVVFVLHSDGTVRVWDLNSHSKLLNHAVTIHELAGMAFLPICPLFFPDIIQFVLFSSTFEWKLTLLVDSFALQTFKFAFANDVFMIKPFTVSF